MSLSFGHPRVCGRCGEAFRHSCLGNLDCVLGRVGLPAWFRRVFFNFHATVRMRIALSAGLEESWSRKCGVLKKMSPENDIHCMKAI